MNVTRCSHVVLTVADLDRSLPFYERVMGLVLTAREDGTAYLRGLEESCHHSLVLVTDPGPAICRRLGFRVYDDTDLDELAVKLAELGLEFSWPEVAHQGRTLHVDDPCGVPLEFCATMDIAPRKMTDFTSFKGGVAGRIDHFQLHYADVSTGADFYQALGFRLSEYIAHEGQPLEGAFLQRKGNPHDMVLFLGPGPRLHHTAYTTNDVHTMLLACDIAGELGYGFNVERGPGRHGPGHALYIYMRDPDGHRMELFTSHYQMIDEESEPIRWTPGDINITAPWGLPGQARWHIEASEFEDTATQTPDHWDPLTLERFLEEQAAGKR
jgi:catechol 2,3-dioxygenase